MLVHEFASDTEVFSWNDGGTVFGVALSHSGGHLAACGAAKSVHVFDIDSGAEVRTPAGCVGDINFAMTSIPFTGVSQTRERSTARHRALG